MTHVHKPSHFNSRQSFTSMVLVITPNARSNPSQISITKQHIQNVFSFPNDFEIHLDIKYLRFFLYPTTTNEIMVSSTGVLVEKEGAKTTIEENIPKTTSNMDATSYPGSFLGTLGTRLIWTYPSVVTMKLLMTKWK